MKRPSVWTVEEMTGRTILRTIYKKIRIGTSIRLKSLTLEQQSVTAVCDRRLREAKVFHTKWGHHGLDEDSGVFFQ